MKLEFNKHMIKAYINPAIARMVKQQIVMAAYELEERYLFIADEADVKYLDMDFVEAAWDFDISVDVWMML